MLDGASSRDSRCLRQAMTWARVMLLISAASFGIGDVGEPFELGGNIGEVAELCRRSARAVRSQPGPWPSPHLMPARVSTHPAPAHS